MDFYQLIKSRKSIRHYKHELISEDLMESILDAGRLANSARNLQEWKFVVVTDWETKAKLIPACRDQQFVGEAGAVIAACAIKKDYTMRCGQPAHIVDLSIAVDHMQLASHYHGLGTCWLGAFYQDRVKKILEIPDEIEVVALLVVGYPAEDGREKSRKSLKEIVYREKWGKN